MTTAIVFASKRILLKPEGTNCYIDSVAPTSPLYNVLRILEVMHRHEDDDDDNDSVPLPKSVEEAAEHFEEACEQARANKERQQRMTTQPHSACIYCSQYAKMLGYN